MLSAQAVSVDVPDEVLAARARGGGVEAFVALVERHQATVYRLALRLSRNSAEAEDITQEAFLRAHGALATFRGDARFVTWLCRIAVNEALMRRRSAKRHPHEPLEAEPRLGLGRDAPREERADELVDRKARAERVNAALGELDDQQRAALVLRDLEGLSADEAADVLGVSPEVVRQRAHRARLKLRERLADLLTDDDERRSRQRLDHGQSVPAPASGPR